MDLKSLLTDIEWGFRRMACAFIGHRPGSDVFRVLPWGSNCRQCERCGAACCFGRETT